MDKLIRVFDLKQIHKTYLLLALTLGTIFSLFMPLFNEPDGQYHLAVSGKIVHSIIDTSRYGEKTIDSGMGRQKSAFKNGTRFEKYYLNKAVFVEPEAMPRAIRYKMYDFVYWGHIIPAAGLLIGRFIYPSMGVMITVARLLSVIVNSLIIYAIIKKVKFAKLTYFLVFLSPVALNSFASLSYDSTGYVAVAFIMMLVINTIAEQKITKTRRNQFLLGTLFVLLASKWNYWLLLTLIPILYLVYYPKCQGIKDKLFDLYQTILSRKRYVLASLLGFVVLGLAVAVILTRNYGGLFYVIQRYLMTFGYNYAGMDLLSNDITSWLVAPYPSQNYMPIWVSAVWYLLFFLAIFSERKWVKNRFIGYTLLAYFLIGVLGVFYNMLGYNGARTSYIEGVQGRYFTPTLLLLPIFTASIKPAVNRAIKTVLPIFIALAAVGTNLLLLFDTTIGLIMR